MIRAYKPDIGVMTADPDANWVSREDLESALVEIEQLQARVAPLESLLEAVESLANTYVNDHNEMDRRTEDLWYYMDRAKQAVQTKVSRECGICGNPEGGLHADDCDFYGHIEASSFGSEKSDG